MLPTGYHWHECDSPEMPGWWQLLGPTGGVAAQIQPYRGRYHVTVGMDGYVHDEQGGSTATLERAKWHVERWVGERQAIR